MWGQSRDTSELNNKIYNKLVDNCDMVICRIVVRSGQCQRELQVLLECE